jgi:PiT family inorganic phosphate transporter
MEILLFLSSGLFLGWSLGANDAANVFGTAVGARMIRFRTAALVCSIFVMLGATVSGTGAALTLGKLGAVNALAGSFTVALAAALTTLLMTRLNIPVSTSQAIVGAIIGWNFYSASLTDSSSLTKIFITWVACPLLSGVMAVLLFMLVRLLLRLSRPHLLRLDFGTRLGLLIVGAFGSYSLGANNIANVMGVFVPDNPFDDLFLFGWLRITGVQQLFLLGAAAIGIGVFTYSARVMKTVGGGLARVSPVPAMVIVLAHSLTLFLFASARLEDFLAGHGLPTFPLVPVSSSQAVIGAIVGLSLFKGIGIRYRVLSEISLGWLATPVVAGLVSILLLFVMDNVFNQQVYLEVAYRLDEDVVAELDRRGVPTAELAGIMVGEGDRARDMQRQLRRETALAPEQVQEVLEVAETGIWQVVLADNPKLPHRLHLSVDRLEALTRLEGARFAHAWEFEQALATASTAWQKRPAARSNRLWNQQLESELAIVLRACRVVGSSRR